MRPRKPRQCKKHPSVHERLASSHINVPRFTWYGHATIRAQPRPERPVFLTIKADRTLAIGNDQVAPAALGAALDAATKSDRQQRLFLRADKSVPYGDVMGVMNLLRRAGYLKVSLVGLEGVEGAKEPVVAPSNRAEPGEEAK
jgi:biopolymer transport protein ExbD